MVIISLFLRKINQMNSFDIFNLPYRYLDDVSDSFHDEAAPTIFVDDYVQEVINNIESLELHHLEELVFKFTKLASFFSRLKNATDKLYGESLLERALDQADMVADGVIDDNENIAFKKVDSEELQEFQRVMRLFEEEE